MPGRGFGRDLLRTKIALRIGDELGTAARAAEMIGVAPTLGMVRGRGWIDFHAADRILDHRWPNLMAMLRSGSRLDMRVVVAVLGHERSLHHRCRV